MADLSGKTVLVTGATQGIGKASAVALGKMGARIVVVGRNREKAEAAVADVRAQSGADVSVIVADLSSMNDVRRAAREFRDAHDRLDVLLNNAGVLVPKRELTVDGFEMTFATNHLAYFLLTRELLDVLRATPGARIVNVASEAHRSAKGVQFDDLQFEKSYSAFKVYCHSKLCNVLFTAELARRLEGSGVTANSLHPGVVASGFGRTYPGFIASLIRVGQMFMISPEKGARTSVYLASSPDVAGVTGKYFDKCKPKFPTRIAQDEATQKKLWEVSEDLLARQESSTPRVPGSSSPRPPSPSPGEGGA